MSNKETVSEKVTRLYLDKLSDKDKGLGKKDLSLLDPSKRKVKKASSTPFEGKSLDGRSEGRLLDPGVFEDPISRIKTYTNRVGTVRHVWEDK